MPTESAIQTHIYKNISVINITNYTSLDQKDKSSSPERRRENL